MPRTEGVDRGINFQGKFGECALFPTVCRKQVALHIPVILLTSHCMLLLVANQALKSEVVSLKTTNCSPLLYSHSTTHLPIALRPTMLTPRSLSSHNLLTTRPRLASPCFLPFAPTIGWCESRFSSLRSARRRAVGELPAPSLPLFDTQPLCVFRE